VALYVPAGRRRRNVIIGLVGALIVGLIVGAFIGRASAPGISDKVSSVQDSARAVTARLQATPIEYQKQLNGSTEFKSGGTVLQSLTDAQATMRGALDDAVWLGPAQRQDVEDALDALVTAAKAKVAAATYAKLVNTAVTRIATGLGIDEAGSG
jgi:hypothetical protein